MKGLVFKCDVDSHVPAGPTYLDPAFRVCSLPGAVPGQTEVPAEVYLKSVYDFDVDDLTLDIFVVLLFWLLFTVVNAIAVEKIEWTHGGFMRRLYKRGKAPKQNDDAVELEIARKAALATENMQPIELVYLFYLKHFIPFFVLTIENRKQEFSCGMSFATLCQCKSKLMEAKKDNCWIR